MSCYNSIVVNAPIEHVWNTIRHFHDLGWGEPVVTSVDIVGDVPGDEVGAKRILNGVFHETLREIDETEHRFVYSIDDGPDPVSKGLVDNYIGTVELHPVTADSSTFVVWRSNCDSDNAEAVADFCNPIYAALLDALKTCFDR